MFTPTPTLGTPNKIICTLYMHLYNMYTYPDGVYTYPYNDYSGQRLSSVLLQQHQSEFQVNQTLGDKWNNTLIEILNGRIILDYKYLSKNFRLVIFLM